MIGVKLILWAILLTLQVSFLAANPKPRKGLVVVLLIALVAGIVGVLDPL
jgi:hypothetical protein